jgi:hypothetical protein
MFLKQLLDIYIFFLEVEQYHHHQRIDYLTVLTINYQ